jgi:tRNA modification GTPase
MLSSKDPIIAQASAVGKAGIGVVRISGGDLGSLLQRISNKPITPRQAHLISLKDEQQQIIDQGLILFFPGPESFTGEDVIEFHGHGGVLLISLVVQRFLSLAKDMNLRLAEPGEFSQRAFLNHKIDLAQAEAIADLIDANSVAAIKSANRSLSGEFSEQIDTLVQKLTHLRMLVEATLDFPEEEIEFLENAKASAQWNEIRQQLIAVLKISQQGALLKNGALVVLAGPPNVGKSSLINALAKQDIAIVTPIAGTTRDQIREQIHLEGVPVQIVDTAGLRESSDAVEKIGIERSWGVIKDADVILFIRDASNANQIECDALLEQIRAFLQQTNNQKVVLMEVWNKKDQIQHSMSDKNMYISAKTGEGLDLLKAKVLKAIGWEALTENVFLARQRHLDALKAALEHIDKAAIYLNQGNATLELFAEELRLAQEFLGDITGKLLPDELLGKIFSSFCIGK